jgi:hypothetical protein
MTRALRRRNTLEEALPSRVAARQAVEAEAERLRQAAVEEKFNAAVGAGLPLEKSISVNKSLRLKFPPPPQSRGFSRILSKVFAPTP